MKRTLLFLALLFILSSSSGQEGLLLSELLYQPVSGEDEYVELYNPADTAVDLSGYFIARWINESMGTLYPLPHYLVAPHDYVVLTKDAASVSACFNVRFPSKVLECNLPPYPNSGGSLILVEDDTVVVDRLDYAPQMHSPLLRNKAGVSLERRSFDRPTMEAGNWFSASSTAGYGTPGYANSQSSEWLVEESAFVFSSTIVSPDGDGYQDWLEIEYKMERGDLMGDIVLFDASGRMVEHILNAALLGTHGSLVWKAKSNLPCGRYVVQIVIYDRGGTRQAFKRTVSVI